MRNCVNPDMESMDHRGIYAFSGRFFEVARGSAVQLFDVSKLGNFLDGDFKKFIESKSDRETITISKELSSVMKKIWCEMEFISSDKNLFRTFRMRANSQEKHLKVVVDNTVPGIWYE